MRLHDIDDASLTHLALNDPNWLFQHAPELVWKNNQQWVIRFKRDWAAANKPIHVLQAHPEWMCAACPTTVLILDVSLMMRVYPSWVQNHRPDIFYCYIDKMLDKAPPPGYHRQTKHTGLIGWIFKIWDDFHMPKYNPSVEHPNMQGDKK